MKSDRPYPLLDRELALLEFNRRVLAQAEDETIPLLERLRFLCIVSGNMDEFFEIRVAGLHAQLDQNPRAPGRDSVTVQELLRRIADTCHELVARQYRLFNEVIIPELAANGVHFLRRNAWSEEQRAWIREYFNREVMPVLTPIALDRSHPFPRLLNKSLNFAVALSGKEAFGREPTLAIVQAPRVLPRTIRLPSELVDVPYAFIFLSSALHAHLDQLFTGLTVLDSYQFRVTRNSDLYVDEEEITDLRTALQTELQQRRFGDAVRLEVADNCPNDIARLLLGQLALGEEDLYCVNGPVNLVRLMNVPDQIDPPDLKYPPFTPGVPARVDLARDLFEVIRERDVLLHHPYQSFKPVLNFIRQAAKDPAVVAIKQTVYRTGAESELMEILIAAARSAKEVTVVVELLARFDEEANINWAERLEEVGAHIVYGVVGHKTHAKMAMVVRREGDRLRRYVHLGTGNYHPRTAMQYTDFGLLTCNEELTTEVHEIFMQLTGVGNNHRLIRIWQSPFTLHARTLQAIAAETQAARDGRPAGIVAKMNALLEPEIIAALYEASKAGCPVDLIVRGICTLEPGIPGLSENIRVRSIIGRFLEHHRIFHFVSTGEVYLSSADWMDRNFFRRVETCFPVLDPKRRRRVIEEGLDACLKDNCEAWLMDSEGRYSRTAPAQGEARFSAQSALLGLMAALPGYGGSRRSRHKALQVTTAAAKT